MTKRLNRLDGYLKGILFLLLLSACSGEDDPLSFEEATGNIEPEISPFIETFVDEAAVRGLSFDFEGFEATFSTEDIMDNEDICGQASPFSSSRDFFTIRQSDMCWIDQPDASREALVFHELGHALLDRVHRDDRFDNGLVKSTMESGMLGPYSEFTPLFRSYLIDELFDESTPDPAWASNKTEVQLVDINSGLESNDDGWQFFSTNNFFRRTDIIAERTDQAAASGNFSLKIESDTPFDETLFWRFRTDALSNLPETADVVINAKIRTQNIEGLGIALAGGFDIDGRILSFSTTENDITIDGTTVFEDYSITIPYYPNRPAVVSIVIAYLPETTGLVFIDDVEVIAIYNPDFGPA